MKTLNAQVVIRPKGQQKKTRGEEATGNPVRKGSKAKSGAEDKEAEPRRGSLGRVTTV